MDVNIDDCLHENHPFPMPAMVYGSIGCSNKLKNYINMDDSDE